MLHDILAIAALAVVAAIAYFGWRLLFAAREKRQVRAAFGQFLSPALVEALAEEPARPQLDGEVRDLSVMACGLCDYDTLAAAMRDDLPGLMQLVNRFLTPLADAILARHGTIDKFLGAGIVAFWNAPRGVPEHPLHACRSALAMIEGLGQLNLQLQQQANAAGRTYRPFEIGIGIDTGQCLVGNLGSAQRFDYSALGPAVTSASGLARRSQEYGVEIIIGEGTRARVPRLALLELDRVATSATAEPMRIFALLGDEAMAQSAAFRSLAEQHEAMLACYHRHEWGQARQCLLACRGREPRLEPLYDLFDERIRHYEGNPPEPNWRGVSGLTGSDG